MTDKTIIFDWTAKRSGSGMTIRGKDNFGDDIVLHNVNRITCGDAGIAAYDGGRRFDLDGRVAHKKPRPKLASARA